jgi:hypothetical protein
VGDVEEFTIDNSKKLMNFLIMIWVALSISYSLKGPLFVGILVVIFILILLTEEGQDNNG